MKAKRVTPALAARLRRALLIEPEIRTEMGLDERDAKRRAARKKSATRRYLRELVFEARRAGEPVSEKTLQMVREVRNKSKT